MGKNNRDGTMSFVSRMAQTYDPDPAHSAQVTILALALFDGLNVLHGYGPGERLLLEIAGQLHDIGASQVLSGKHHKLSGDLIQELDIPGLARRDRITCALIARYHTKALPDASRHKRFAALGNGRRAVVEWLAGILRVADGLDCKHANTIRRLECAVNGKAIKIHLRVTGDCRMEVARAVQKQALLLKKTERKVEYLC